MTTGGTATGMTDGFPNAGTAMEKEHGNVLQTVKETSNGNRGC